jgi:hypothetical protein
MTVGLVLALGIGLSYLVANTIFRLMGHRDRKPASAALKPAAASTSGD